MRVSWHPKAIPWDGALESGVIYDACINHADLLISGEVLVVYWAYWAVVTKVWLVRKPRPNQVKDIEQSHT